jgi:hypothetical protein
MTDLVHSVGRLHIHESYRPRFDWFSGQRAGY